jgi:hypothetical protein
MPMYDLVVRAVKFIAAATIFFAPLIVMGAWYQVIIKTESVQTRLIVGVIPFVAVPVIMLIVRGSHRLRRMHNN